MAIQQHAPLDCLCFKKKNEATERVKRLKTVIPKVFRIVMLLELEASGGAVKHIMQ